MTGFIDRDHRLVAILRGVRPDEVEGIVAALLEAGFRAVEVPLNSPEPFESIRRAVAVAGRLAPGECLVGAGTVLTVAEVAAVREAGGGLVVSPNMDPAVIGATRAAGMVSLPGVLTPTEAFAALAAGASGLKFFPASLLGPGGIRAIHAVLPPETRSYAVGGVGPANLAEMIAAGAHGAGLGSELYKPGADAATVGAAAKRMVAALAAPG